jgi:hypothetical protein
MSERADEELLQRALDGAVDEAEAARLRARLESDPAFRARAEQLRRLANLLEEPRAEPPPAFADDVMRAIAAGTDTRAPHAAGIFDGVRQLFGGFLHHSRQNERTSESPWMAGWAGGGAIVAKKALWAVAGLALIVILAVVYFNGTRSVNSGAEGTIGAADRYRGTQPTGKDVVAPQAAAQKFLQSDLFDRIVKDKAVRSLLRDRDACALIASLPEAALRGGDDAQAWEALKANRADIFKNDDLYAALRSNRARAGVAAMEAQAALSHRAMRLAVADPELLMALRNAREALAKATDEQWAEALRSNRRAVELASSQQDPLADLRKNHNFTVAMREDGDSFMNLISQRAFRDALDDNAFMNLMKNEAALKAMEDANFASLMANHASFMAAFDNKEFASLIRNDEFMAALRSSGDFEAALRAEGFQASLRDMGALEAALRSHGEVQ